MVFCPRNSASIVSNFPALGFGRGFSLAWQYVLEPQTDRTGKFQPNLLNSFLPVCLVIQSYIRDRDTEPGLSTITTKNKTTVCSAYPWVFVCLFHTSSVLSSHPTPFFSTD